MSSPFGDTISVACPVRGCRQELAAAIAGIWTVRQDRYSELRTAETADLPKVEMSFIGG
jgi:cyclic pyranopterin phosphate synthase